MGSYGNVEPVLLSMSVDHEYDDGSPIEASEDQVYWHAKLFAPEDLDEASAKDWAYQEIQSYGPDYTSREIGRFVDNGWLDLQASDIEAMAEEGVYLEGYEYSDNTEAVIRMVTSWDAGVDLAGKELLHVFPVSQALSRNIARATTHIRRLAREGDGGQLEHIARRLKKPANNDNPLAISVLHAVNVLRKRNIHDPAFMPLAEDIGKENTPPPFDEPLAPNLEAQAQNMLLAVQENPRSKNDSERMYYGLAGSDMYDQSIRSIEDARQEVWDSHYGAIPEFIKKGIMNDLDVPDMFKANGDDYTRAPSSKGRRTLAGIVRGILRKRGNVNWRGVKISKKNPLSDLAIMGQVIKDPRLEQSVIVYLDENNVVVGRPQVWSTRSFESTPAKPLDFDNVAENAASLGATKVVSMHNHPTGHPGPSSADIAAFKQWAEASSKYGLEFLGEVIVDEIEYATITQEGMEVKSKVFQLPEGYHREYVKPGAMRSLNELVRYGAHVGSDTPQYYDPLTTPGLEQEAVLLNGGSDYNGPLLMSARAEVVARYPAKIALSQEDKAQMLMQQTEALSVLDEQGALEGDEELSAIILKNGALKIAYDLGHETKKIVLVRKSADTNMVYGVELVDPALLQNPEDFAASIQAYGGKVDLYITKEMADTVIEERDSDGNPMETATASDILRRLHRGGGIDNFVEGAEVSKYHAELLSVGDLGMPAFGPHFLNSNEKTQEEILFLVGLNPSLTRRELTGKTGLVYQWSTEKGGAPSPQSQFEKFKANNNTSIIDHYVSSGVAQLQKWRIIPTDFDVLQSEQDWRALSQSAQVARSQVRTKGPIDSNVDSRTLRSPIFKNIKTSEWVRKVVEASRGDDQVTPLEENEENTKIIDDHMMGGTDHTAEMVDHLNVLSDADTMSTRFKMKHAIRRPTEIYARLVAALRRRNPKGSWNGYKEVAREALSSVNAYTATWTHDTNVAMKHYLNDLNETRKNLGQKPIEGITDFVEEFNLAASYAGEAEYRIKGLRDVWHRYGAVDKDGNYIGLTPQETRDLSRFINAKTAIRRIIIARRRWQKFNENRDNLLAARAELSSLRAEINKGYLSRASESAIEESNNKLAIAEENYRHLRASHKLQKKNVIEEVVKDEDGKFVERRFNETFINPGGLTEAQANGALQEMERRLGNEKFAKLEAVEGELGNFWGDMLTYSVEGGIVSAEDAARMVNDNEPVHALYLTPIDVIRHHNDKLRRTGNARGNVNLGDAKLYQAMVGTQNDSRDPMAASIDRIIAVSKAVARNKAVKMLHESAMAWETPPDLVEARTRLVHEDARAADQRAREQYLEEVSELVKEADPATEKEPDYDRISYWRDGRKVDLDVYKPIADSMNNVNRPQVGMLMGIWRSFTTILRHGATTLSPSFIFVGVPRDLYAQYINAENPLKPWVWKDYQLLWSSYGSTLSSAFGRGDGAMFEAYQRFAGGFGSQIQTEMDPAGDAKALKKIGPGRRKLLGRWETKAEAGKESPMNWFLSKADATLRAIYPHVGNMSIAEAFEQGTRFAVFRKQLESETGESMADLDKTADKILEETKIYGGTSKAQKDLRDTALRKAIFAGKQGTVDFSEGGKFLLWVNLMAPFANAPVAAAHSTVRGVKRNPSRALAAVGAGMLTATILSIVNRMNYGDLLDEDEDWSRDKNFGLIVSTYVNENGDTKPISLKFPKGDYLSGILKPIEVFWDHIYRARKDPNYGYFKGVSGADLLFDHAVQLFSDISPVEFARDGDIQPMLFTKYAPVALRQFFEITSDKNFFFDRAIEGNLRDLLPEDRIRRDTSESAIFMSRIAGSVFDVLGNREDNWFSPVRIDALAKGFFAEAGDIAMRVGGVVVGRPDAGYFRNGTYKMFGDTSNIDMLEAFSVTPVIKRFVSVGGRNEERQMIGVLEEADRVMGSRRIRELRPVRQLVASYKRGRMTRDEFMDVASNMTANQQHMLMNETDKEMRGLGSGENVARFLSSMGISDWGRSVGILHLMNSMVTRPEDRIQLLRTLSHSKILTPAVLSQLMVLSGSGALKGPAGMPFLAVPPILREGRGLAGFAELGALPFMPTPRKARSFGGSGLGSGGF